MNSTHYRLGVPAVLLCGASFLPVAESGRSVRSVYGLVSIADRAGLLQEPYDVAIAFVFLIPFASILTCALLLVGQTRGAALVAVAPASVALATIALVTRSPLSLAPAGWFLSSVAVVTLVAAIHTLVGHRLT